MLLQLMGPDQPGITAELMNLLAQHDADIDDVEQVAIRRQLVLGVIAKVSNSAVLHDEVAQFAARYGLTASLDPIDAAPTERGLGVVVTVMAPRVTPEDLSAIATAIAGAHANIDKIHRLARYPVWAYELSVLGAPIEHVRRELAAVAKERHLDIAVQKLGITRRAQRLVVLDVDSTLIQNEVIELLAAQRGCFDEVRAVTESAMSGNLDFADSLRHRVALLEGLTLDQMQAAREQMSLTPGARTFVRTLQRLGFKVAIVSGGFTYFTDYLQQHLGLEYAFANQLELIDGVATGRVTGPIVDRRRKAELLREIARAESIPLEQVVAVGDGANDLDMLEVAGLGVAFNAKAVVQQAADTTVNVPYLDTLLFVMGISREEIDAADLAG